MRIGRDAYLQKIVEVIFERLSIAGIAGEQSHIGDLAIDSLDYIDFINALDDEFGVEIKPEAAVEFKTIGDIINWLEAAA